MQMSIRNIVRLNSLLVAGIFIYGIGTDEPYFRAVGHTPCLFDYLFWFALVVNGPSGFIADYVSHTIVSASHFEWQFAIQYGLWLLFLWPQWKCYDVVVRWCVGDRRRETVLYVAIASITLIGLVGAHEAWIYGHRPRELAFIDRYFWFVRVAGIALSGLVILGYSQFRKRDPALTEHRSQLPGRGV